MDGVGVDEAPRWTRPGQAPSASTRSTPPVPATWRAIHPWCSQHARPSRGTRAALQTAALPITSAQCGRDTGVIPKENGLARLDFRRALLAVGALAPIFVAMEPAAAQSGWVYRCGGEYTNTLDEKAALQLERRGCRLVGSDTGRGPSAPAAPPAKQPPASPERGAAADAAPSCPTFVTLELRSVGYSGPFEVEFRAGSRPGSRLLQRQVMQSRGSWTVPQVCAGENYFFTFSTPDAERVSVTRYFSVQTLNDVTITVTYSRDSGQGQRVGREARGSL